MSQTKQRKRRSVLTDEQKAELERWHDIFVNIPHRDGVCFGCAGMEIVNELRRAWTTIATESREP